MARKMPFRIGADASCSDGACGQVSRIIVNPVAREVTHLVVGQKHGRGPGRLVPADLVDATTGQLRLRCTLAEFQALQPAQETEVVPDLDPTGHQGSPRSGNFLPVSPAVWLTAGGRSRRPEAPQKVTVDSVPSGEIDIRRELTVCATDGEIGQVQGLIVEPGGHHVTHVLLQEGRMWGRKEVAVPIGAVTKLGTLLIHLSLTKHQVKDLPRGPSSTRVLWIAPDSALVADDNLYFTCEDCRRYLKYDTFFNRLARDNLGWSIVKACALRYGLDRVCCIRLAVRTGDRRGILERPKRANRLCSGIRDLEFCGKIAIATFKEIIIASRRIDYSS
jgi:sporulation protein YlmC with PRC-barrel domain